jgi:hypothetical protein
LIDLIWFWKSILEKSRKYKIIRSKFEIIRYVKFWTVELARMRPEIRVEYVRLCGFGFFRFSKMGNDRSNKFVIDGWR